MKKQIFRKIPTVSQRVSEDDYETYNAMLISRVSIGKKLFAELQPHTSVKPVIVRRIDLMWDYRDRDEIPF